MPDRDLALQIDVKGRSWPLVGRARELDRLATVLQDRGRSAVIRGEVGVGKSRLLVDLLDRASRSGPGGDRGQRPPARTVVVRATRSTATIPFGPFAAWTVDPSVPAAADRLQVLRTIARVLLDGDGPVIVGIDDAHLLDEGSAALVLHIAAHTTACVVATVRTGQPCPDAVVALWKEGLAELVELRPLPEPDLAELVSRALPGGHVDPALQRRLWALTRGTPLFLREVLRAGVGQQVVSHVAGAWRWRGQLAGGGKLRDLLDDRFARLGPDERRTLELVALGEPLPLDIVDHLGRTESLAKVERQGLVVISDADTRDVGVGHDGSDRRDDRGHGASGHGVGHDGNDRRDGSGRDIGSGDDTGGHPVARLAHPLYGEVLRAGVSSLVAREHQRALAAAAVAVGWQERDPLRVAAWWLRSGAVPGPAGVFVAAARRALALGEWELADRLGEAAEASGAGPEVALTRAAALVHLGGWRHAGDFLARVAPEAIGSDALAEYARLRAGFLTWSEGRAVAGSEVLVEAAGRLPSPARARVLAQAAYVALSDGRLDEAIGLATEAMNDAGPVVEPRVQGMAVAALAAVVQGRTAATLCLAETAAPFVAAALAADPYPDNPAGAMGAAYGLALVLDGRLGEAGAWAESALEHVRRRQELEATRSIVVSLAGGIALLQGSLTLAEQRGREGMTRNGLRPPSRLPAAVAAMAAAQRGAPDDAEEAQRWAEDSTPPIPLYQHTLALARAWTAAARGELSTAQALAGRAAAGAGEAGAWLFEMLALVDLARLGAPDRAAIRLGELSQVIEGPYVASMAAYAGAAARHEGQGLDEVSAHFEAMGAWLLAAEAAATAARAHGAAGRRDRHLAAATRARRLAARCDSPRTPALRDLDAVPAWAVLTGREREVVDLAGRGLSNREIAARLGVSIRTVTSHLHHAYTKLGSGDRSQLVQLAGSAGRFVDETSRDGRDETRPLAPNP